MTCMQLNQISDFNFSFPFSSFSFHCFQWLKFVARHDKLLSHTGPPVAESIHSLVYSACCCQGNTKLNLHSDHWRSCKQQLLRNIALLDKHNCMPVSSTLPVRQWRAYMKGTACTRCLPITKGTYAYRHK